MNVATLLRRAPAVSLAAEGPAQVAARRLSPRLFWHRLALGLTLLFLALFVAVLIAAVVANDGRSNWYKGVQLVTVYAMTALALYLVPSG